MLGVGWRNMVWSLTRLAVGTEARRQGALALVDGEGDRPAVVANRQPRRGDVVEGRPGLEVGAEAGGQGEQGEEQKAGSHKRFRG